MYLEAFLHLLEDCERDLQSPRAVHCFYDEDVIGQWKRLAAGTCSNWASHFLEFHHQ